MRAIASYSRSNVSGSRRTSIAVAGAVAAHQAAALGNLGAQPLPADIFLAEDDNAFPEFFGDRQTVQEYTHAVIPQKKKRIIVRAVSRTGRELEKLGGAQLLVAAADGIIGWLESNHRSRWREALNEPGMYGTVSFSHRELVAVLEAVAVANPALAPGARRLATLISEPWAELERVREEQNKATRA